MSHDHAFGSALIVFALLLWAILTIRHERHADRSRLPGALQGDDPSQPWEATPIFEQLCFEQWESDLRAKPVIDTDWTEGPS